MKNLFTKVELYRLLGACFILIIAYLDSLQAIFSKIWSHASLANFSSLAGIVGSFSVVVAVLTYYNDSRRNKVNYVIDQVSFFRKEIIFENNEFVKFIREIKGKRYEFHKIKLNEISVEYARNNFQKECQSQFEMSQIDGCFPKQTFILNMLEELALKIKYTNTINHLALNSIKTPFVELVEIHAVTLLSHREILSGLPTYNTVLEIYSIWRDSVDRRTPEQRRGDLKLS